MLLSEAKATKWFDTVTMYGPDDMDSDFKTRFGHILNKRRGGGYWIWKSYFIQKKLSEIDDGDILIYLDTGCKINEKGKKRFHEYIEMLEKSDKGIISFDLSRGACRHAYALSRRGARFIFEKSQVPLTV